MTKRVLSLLLSLIVVISAFSGCTTGFDSSDTVSSDVTSSQTVTPEKIPDYSGNAYVVVNDNIPYFTESEITDVSFENYSPLDNLGRCGVCIACVGIDIMPTEERGEIGQVKPTGWQTVKYDCVDGKYLYNRCHLIGFQLTGENANRSNLITGTRYLNVTGMLPFENMVADYVKETHNHVIYRVTPIFKGNNLVADGVLMEAFSVEDDEIRFNVFCYNVQPGIVIDYATGDSRLDDGKTSSAAFSDDTSSNIPDAKAYILNTNTKKFHNENCGLAKDITEKNKKIFEGDRQELINSGYSPCKTCNP